MRRRPGRTASMRWGIHAFLVSALALAGLIALLSRSRPGYDRSPVFVYCAAGLKGPVEEIARAYEEEYGVEVQLTYGGSETMLTNAKVSGTGDLIIPADFSYIDKVREMRLLDEDIPVATMRPVVAVKAGNPKQIHTLDDLYRKDVTVGLANPEVAAVGKITHDALKKINRWEPLKRKGVFKATVPLVATDVRIGEVDAGIVWDATVKQFGKHLEAVEIPELKNVTSNVAVGVLRSCETPASALRFARYLSARDKGLTIFEKHGFVTIPDGDLWAEGDPEILMHAGAMLQPAIKQTVHAFAQREGITPSNIRTVYNGCGVLVSQMKAKDRPDVFFACDAKYLDDPLKNDAPDGQKIKDLFLAPTEISNNKLVIMVPKGNPKKIRGLRDLTRKGMRIGVGDEHKCAMGALTEETFRQGNIRGRVNIVVKLGTGDMLVNAFQAAPDELDAVVVYISNAQRVLHKFDTVEVDLDCAIASQPIATGKESNHRHLIGRLIRAITSDESRQRFEENGFKWKATR